RTNKTAPRSAPIDDGEAGAPASDGPGLATGRMFSRTRGSPQTSSEPGPHNDSAGALAPGQGSGGRPDRGRSTGSGRSGASLAAVPREGDSLSGLSPTRIRSAGEGAIEKNAGRVPAPYRLRTSPQRKKIAVEMGANEESERAVELSLQWLAAHQHRQGYWEPIESTLGREPEQIKWDSAE